MGAAQETYPRGRRPVDGGNRERRRRRSPSRCVRRERHTPRSTCEVIHRCRRPVGYSTNGRPRPIKIPPLSPALDGRQMGAGRVELDASYSNAVRCRLCNSRHSGNDPFPGDTDPKTGRAHSTSTERARGHARSRRFHRARRCTAGTAVPCRSVPTLALCRSDAPLAVSQWHAHISQGHADGGRERTVASPSIVDSLASCDGAKQHGRPRVASPTHQSRRS